MVERTLVTAEGLRPYLPRILVGWLNERPGTTARDLEGSVVFVDISGFTKMSERLARNGKVGAEEVTDVLGSVFAKLLVVAYENGGSLVKFGGDALMLFFAEEEHELRATRAAFGMRGELRSAGKIETSAGLVTLRMSVGVHSGVFNLFLVGRSHRELIITGPAASETVLMENTAEAGEILVIARRRRRCPRRRWARARAKAGSCAGGPQTWSRCRPNRSTEVTRRSSRCASRSPCESI